MSEAPKITADDVRVPADVPASARETYIQNYLAATRGSGRLMLMAGDQKLEHLNDDFYGTSSLGPIPEDDNQPDHLFNIASKAQVGVLAVQYGLASHYARDHPDVNYLIKMNSKSHLVKTAQRDPLSNQLWSVDQVMRLKENGGVNVVAVGYTIYFGSEFEPQMLREASQLVSDAHQHGLLVVFWAYPRGQAVADEKDPHLVAGAAGASAALGADFVKVNYPKKTVEDPLKEAVMASGRTGLICAGGSSKGVREFLQDLSDQIHVSGAAGNATGRNIHQKPLAEAVRFSNAISAITIGGKDVDFALKVYEGDETFQL